MSLYFDISFHLYLFHNIQVRNHLFEGSPNPHEKQGLGLDLVALNIQRGRDHGIPGYIEYRKICQVGPFASFDDLHSNISPEVLMDFDYHTHTIITRS